MKRTRTQAFGGGYKNKQFKKPRSTAARAYPNSRVPPASRGYRANRVERKVFDVDNVVTDADTSSRITCICMPTLGTDMTNRVGRKLTIRSFQARILVRTERAQLVTAATIPAQMVRVMFIVDMQPNGAAPSITDILKYAHPTSPLNLDNRDRFKMVCDKVWTLDPYMVGLTASSTYASTTNQIKHTKIYKKMSQEVIFNATNGGTIADITSGALLQVVLGSQAVSATNTAETVIGTRVRFTDD